MSSLCNIFLLNVQESYGDLGIFSKFYPVMPQIPAKLCLFCKAGDRALLAVTDERQEALQSLVQLCGG